MLNYARFSQTMEDIDYEKTFVRTVTLYDVGCEWVCRTHANSTTVDRGTGGNCYVNVSASNRSPANGDSDCNCRTNIAAADHGADIHR